MKSQDATQNGSSSLTTVNHNSTVGSTNSGALQSQGPNWSKIQALKQRKSELEKLLAEKSNLLQKIEKQEASILANANHVDTNGDHCWDNISAERKSNHSDDNINTVLRNKLDNSLKVSKKQLSTKDQNDVERLLLERKMQQEICTASYKLATDSTLTKSMRRTHQVELEQAQSRLAAINHNLDMIKKRQLSHLKGGYPQQKQQSMPNTSSVISPTSNVITLNLTKSNPTQNNDSNFDKNGIRRCEDDSLSNNLMNSKKYGSSNSVSNYYASERRNPAMTRNALRRSDDHMHFDYVSHANRIGDVHRVSSMHSNGNESLSSYHIPFENPAAYCDYVYMTSQQKVEDLENLSNIQKFNNLPNRSYPHDGTIKSTGHIGTSKPRMHLVEGPYPNDNKFYCTPQQTYDDSILVRNLSPKHGMRQSYNFSGLHPNCFLEDRYVVMTDKTQKYLAVNTTPPGNMNSLRKYQRNALDVVSMSPPGVTILQDQPILGLGGYWRTLPNNERVWCVVDNRYDNNTMKYERAKKPAPQPTKSSSLGNFESITACDEMGDKVSISSVNSETSKKPKEKQWLETSLDGPMVKAKQNSSSDSSSIKTMPLYNYTPTHSTGPNYIQNASLQNQHRQNVLSPQSNPYDSGISPNYQVNKQQIYRDRPKLSSHSMCSVNYRSPVKRIENQIHLTHSVSISPGDHVKTMQSQQAQDKYLVSQQNQIDSAAVFGLIDSYQLHQKEINILNGNDLTLTAPQLVSGHQNMQAKHAPMPSPVLGHNSNNSNYDTLRSNRSPIVANMSKAPDIRVESPKNMTVIQQAIFMPYKEVTKPFEMSDFYKYSTKFRQKEQKQPNPTPVAVPGPNNNLE